MVVSSSQLAMSSAQAIAGRNINDASGPKKADRKQEAKDDKVAHGSVTDKFESSSSSVRHISSVGNDERNSDSNGDNLDSERDTHSLGLKEIQNDTSQPGQETLIVQSIFKQIIGEEFTINIKDYTPISSNEKTGVLSWFNSKNFRNAYGMEYGDQSFFYEFETNRFEFESIINTSDGEQVKFKLNFDLTREFVIEYDFKDKFIDAVNNESLSLFVDRFSGELTNTRFEFEIFVTDDEFPFTGKGKGQIAFDLLRLGNSTDEYDLETGISDNEILDYKRAEQDIPFYFKNNPSEEKDSIVLKYIKQKALSGIYDNQRNIDSIIPQFPYLNPLNRAKNIKDLSQKLEGSDNVRLDQKI